MIEKKQNIKIPYPSEGVIRTAAIDDTVAPEDSVQIAVNMNFDRIGAFQTRLGLTEYADDLDGEIKNFGTLNNSVIPPGFSTLAKFAPENMFADPAQFMSSVRIDDTHIITFYSSTGDDGFVHVNEIDLDTGELTALGTPLEFDVGDGRHSCAIKIDATHFLNVWRGPGTDGFAQVFSVNTSTWAVTAEGSPLEFNTADGSYFTLAQVDANHFIVFYRGTSVGVAEILEVNLGTWAVTQPGSPLTFDAADVAYNKCAALGDGIHFINFWSGTGSGSDGFARVFAVNTGTWAITALSSPLEFDTSDNSYNSCASLGDGEHFINFWTGNGSDGFVQVFNVDPGTFAVTALGTPLEFDTDFASFNACISGGDGEHFINFWKGFSGIDYGQIFEVDQTTFQVTGVGSPLSFGGGNVSAGAYNDAVLMTATRIVLLWSTTSGAGVGSLFQLSGDIVFRNWLYAQQEDGDVLNWDNPGWVVRRTGLNPANKARFAQYLNLIWMVNGNELEGGDPVQTSNGGNFGTDLVPEGFPPGDFIQAGFEGRVWIVDKLAGVVYFTNIVQFTPPNTYTLTYTPESNFIKNFSPQNGQSPTGLFTTPRALLLFQQDYIYRIYGALSVDNYPAYNVGTYSQESIIQAKDGIYFHHSSGFYKFAYDSQPIEISRRIIDFIQAIPRSNYENIVGIYDGFDVVEWAIGAVTVEGVTFTNCVCRFTISTQVWTIYDYPGNYITALISYDDGEDLNMIMGTDEGKVSKMDDGFTDLGENIYYEIIDRWRTYADVYAKTQQIGGLSIYNENAGGAKIGFQTQKSFPNVWDDLGTIDENASALLPNSTTEDFNAGRLRISGVTKGNPVVFHGIEILEVEIKGYDKN